MKPLKLALALATLAASTVCAEVVRTKERAYVVRYADNSTERYAVKWTLDVSESVREEGGSYVPYQGATENRRCVWSTASTVERSVSLVTRLGQTISLASMNRNLPVDAKKVSGSHPGSCTAARPEANSALAEARRAGMESFDRMSDADLVDLQKAARANADVTAVTVQ